MADFPTSLPSITNPTANDTLAAVPHHTQHEHANDNLAAIGTKLGTGASTPTIGKVLRGAGTGTSAWSLTQYVTPQDYGAAADGVTDDTTAIASALAAGYPEVRFPEGTYRVTNTLTPLSSTRVVGLPGAKLVMDSASVSRLFVMSGKTEVHISGFEIDGNDDTTPTDALIVWSSSSSRCSLTDCYIYDLPSASTGAIVVSSSETITIARNRISGAEGTTIGISGGYGCLVTGNRISGGAGLGIRLGEAAYSNTISDNTFSATGLEPVGVTYDCYYNRIVGNDCNASAGDNGISITGHHNTVIGNTIANSYKSGVGVWGSHNSIVGNVIRNANLLDDASSSGVSITSGYGGTGQYNAIVGNVIHDDQASVTMTHNVRISDGSSYTTWAAGQVIGAGTIYRVYGLNIYQASGTGTTGATPPTHTSGTASDGAVSWTYLNSYRSVARPAFNHVQANAYEVAGSGVWDQNGWTENVAYERDVPGSLRIGPDYAGWTSVDDVTITAASDNVGIAIQPGSAKIGRVSFGVSALKASLGYDDSTGALTLAGGSAHGALVVITSLNSVLLGSASLATSSTDGFVYIPKVSGAPSGTPTGQSGRAPMVYDATNNRIYIYDHADGAWRYAALT